MRSRKQWIGYFIALAALAAVIAQFVQMERVGNVPDISKRTGHMTAASELLNLQKAMEYYRYEIRRKPEVVKNYVQLAQSYLQQARITGRHHEYVTEAQRYLTEALSREPGNFAAVINQASVFLIYHNFEEARAWAEKAISINAFNAFVWGVYSDALKELGEYEKAVAACDKMLSIRPDLRSYSRASHLREIHGDPEGAKAAMRLAVNSGVIGTEAHAWASVHLGNLYLKEGKLDTAQSIFAAVLQTRQNYPFAVSGLAKIAVARDDYDGAIQHLLQAYRTAPEHQFMEDMIQVYRLQGADKRANVLTQSVLAAFHQHEKLGWNVNLEYARFCLANEIDLAEALDRAGKEYQHRPNNLEVLEVYAWAQHKSS